MVQKHALRSKTAWEPFFSSLTEWGNDFHLACSEFARPSVFASVAVLLQAEQPQGSWCSRRGLTRRWHKAAQSATVALLYSKCRSVLLHISMRNQTSAGCKLAVKSKELSDSFAAWNILNAHEGGQEDIEKTLKCREMDTCELSFSDTVDYLYGVTLFYYLFTPTATLQLNKHFRHFQPIGKLLPPPCHA